MARKDDLNAILEDLSILIIGLLFIAFPLLFLPQFTDFFILPKEILFIGLTLLLLFFWGVRFVSELVVKFSQTPFDRPMIFFGAAIILSALFAVNRYESLIAVVPLVFTVIFYFVITNLIRSKQAVDFVVISFVVGAGLAAAISILSFFGIFILPFSFAKTQGFSSFGSLLDQAIYLTLALPLGGFYLLRRFGSKLTSDKSNNLLHPVGLFLLSITSVVIVIGLLLTIYQLATTQKPIVLPFNIGFQTAFAAISQDSSRPLQSFLFGSGFGTYATDFTRFKLDSFNYLNIWSLTFMRSSSFALELLATTGVLGLGTFLFLVFKLLKNVLEKMRERELSKAHGIALALGAIGSLFLPLTPLTQIALFMMIAFFAIARRLENNSEDKYCDVELKFIASKKGFFPFSTNPVSANQHQGEAKTRVYTHALLPLVFFSLFTVFVLASGFYAYKFALSDFIFKRSLVAASQNNGLQTYVDQVSAIRTFPYRDSYYRIASQTDLALANSLIATVPKNSSPSAQIQTNVLNLIQESIDTAKSGVTLSPQTSLNWQNLSSIYQGLIGFGKNAESFAVVTQQKAIEVDPRNPQNYIVLGGIYYQLGLWDKAQNQFEIAVSLKNDYANAYYNLGHAQEAKGDLQNALANYQKVEMLSANDKTSTEKITKEIKALQAKIGSSATEQTSSNKASSTNQPPLNITAPSPKLPAQNPPVKIPEPATDKTEKQTQPTPTKTEGEKNATSSGANL